MQPKLLLEVRAQMRDCEDCNAAAGRSVSVVEVNDAFGAMCSRTDAAEMADTPAVGCRRTIWLLLALALTVLVGCARQNDDPGGGSPVSHAEHAHTPVAEAPSSGVPGMAEIEVPFERRQAIGVRTATLDLRPLVQRIRTVGLVTADERQVRKVQTKVSGWISELYVNFTGEKLSVGQPVLSIYSPDLVTGQREYLLALNASRSAAGAGREHRLLLESARTRLLYWDLTEAQIKQLEESGTIHRTTTLHSPISGYVTLKPVFAGMYVTPEMELYTVADLSDLWVWADIFEDEIPLVQPGQGATIALAAAPGVGLPATVSYINPTMETATRTLRVRFDVANRDGRLKPGMYATVEIESPIGEVLALPEDAVIDTGERKVVFVATGEHRFQPREVMARAIKTGKPMPTKLEA